MYVPFKTKFHRNHHHHHDNNNNKHQGLDPLIRSVSKVTTPLSNVSSVFQLFSFLVVCSGMISKRFGFVAFFASVETSSVCIHLPSTLSERFRSSNTSTGYCSLLSYAPTCTSKSKHRRSQYHNVHASEVGNQITRYTLLKNAKPWRIVTVNSSHRLLCPDQDTRFLEPRTENSSAQKGNNSPWGCISNDTFTV